MTFDRTIAALAIALLACGAFASWATAASPLAALESPEGGLNPGALGPMAPDRPAVPTARQGATGNPLWGIPVRVLTATRERPLFSPSRRPPAPPIVAAPQLPPRPAPAAKPAPPDHPLLTVVGTIIGESEGIGVFIDQATNDIIRLHTGQDHDGWILRKVRGRETVFEKEDRTATLALPAPDAPAGSAQVPANQPTASIPVPAAASPIPVAAPQAGNTWVDGDGQLITPPAQKILQTNGAAGRAR
jgi:general secretion pathway protein N